MAKHVVAGVTGRVGSIVASELLKQGHQVTVIVRDEARSGLGATGSAGGLRVARRSILRFPCRPRHRRILCAVTRECRA